MRARMWAATTITRSFIRAGFSTLLFCRSFAATAAGGPTRFGHTASRPSQFWRNTCGYAMAAVADIEHEGAIHQLDYLRFGVVTDYFASRLPCLSMVITENGPIIGGGDKSSVLHLDADAGAEFLQSSAGGNVSGR